ncbi:MAG: hypothetical protein Q4F65_01455 [Propionibacteriaceae bacterium]|nr:hypothetical protein [Propionibacteriaceae bacterium]
MSIETSDAHYAGRTDRQIPGSEIGIACEDYLLRELSFTGLAALPHYLDEHSIVNHLPVMMFLVGNVDNRRMAALGGNLASGYFALCQALLQEGADEPCLAVGAWGPDGSTIPEPVLRHNDSRYGARSSVLSLEDQWEAAIASVRALRPSLLLIDVDGLLLSEEAILRRILVAVKAIDATVFINVSRTSFESGAVESLWVDSVGNHSIHQWADEPSRFLVGRLDGKLRAGVSELLEGTSSGFVDLRDLLHGLGDVNRSLVDAGYRVDVGSLGEDRLTRLVEIYESRRSKLLGIFQSILSTSSSALRVAESRVLDLEHQARFVQSPSTMMELSPAGLEVASAGSNDRPVDDDEQSDGTAAAAERELRFHETTILTRMLEEERSRSITAQEAADTERRRIRNLRAQAKRARDILRRDHQVAMREASAKLSSADARIASLEGQVRDLSASVERIHQSRSWRLTAWLRRSNA